MKRLVAISVLAFAPLMLVKAASPDGGAINNDERAFLIQQMEKTKKDFLASISGLSDAQWKFKPAPAVWSVAECAEHIVLAEDFIFEGSQSILKTPAVDRLPTSTLDHDRAFAAAVLDRSHKATAPEPIVPSGKFNSPSDAAKAFMEKRDAHIAYVKSTQDDLRIHTAPGPAGQMDAYEFLVLMAAHSGRHTEQIKEVQGNANYPGK